MDEILIEEKKYVSSKRAAKVTGYAKDYIGQLCREGRVPARLVGRNWYVLETAIHDHRFGEDKIEQKTQASPASELSKGGSASVFQSTWDPPRYEASSSEALPSINRILETNSQASVDDKDEVSHHLQDSWKAWFDRVADTAPIIPDIVPEKPLVEEVEEKEVKIPINVIHHQQYQPPPGELLPSYSEVVAPSNYIEQRDGRVLERAIQIVGVILAVLAVSLAIIGSGYLDKYVISNNQVGIISGAVLYNK